uniref:Secreted salivary protein Salp15 n=1 Tax=Ixodes holocyclus TaxID=65647 RepID=A0A1S5R122_IXOHO|nr:secreted salivary protein Salp15 [Ixodes holocyclus]
MKIVSLLALCTFFYSICFTNGESDPTVETPQTTKRSPADALKDGLPNFITNATGFMGKLLKDCYSNMNTSLYNTSLYNISVARVNKNNISFPNCTFLCTLNVTTTLESNILRLPEGTACGHSGETCPPQGKCPAGSPDGC